MALHSYHCLSKGKGLGFLSNNKLSHCSAKRRCSFWLEKIWVRCRPGPSFSCRDSRLLSCAPRTAPLPGGCIQLPGKQGVAQPSSLFPLPLTGNWRHKASASSRARRPLPGISAGASRACGQAPSAAAAQTQDTSGLSANMWGAWSDQPEFPASAASLSSWWPLPSSSTLRLSLAVNAEPCFSFQ